MSEIEALPDADLVAAYLSGDSDAFAAIYDRYADRLFSQNLTVLGDREDAADATHDAFIEAATRMDQLENPEELRAWLFAISRKEAHSRGGERSRTTPEEGLSEAMVTEPAVAPVALRARVLDKVDRGVATTTGSAPSPEWVSLGIVAVVALVVGLIGLAVSAQFEPLSPPSTVPVGDAPPIAGDPTTTTSTSIGPSPTTTTTIGSTSTTATPAPAAIELSTVTVDLGDDGSVASFEVTNTGGSPARWSLASSSNAITVSATEGELGAGDAITIDLSLDREQIEEGEISETLTVTWSEGQIPIAVVGTNEGNPIIHNPQANPPSVQVSGDPACSNLQSTISARVRDASPLESVVVRWSPDGSTEQETAMSPVGNDMFEGVVGPFTAVHTATVRIVAFDELGNAGGATTQVAVVACP